MIVKATWAVIAAALAVAPVTQAGRGGAGGGEFSQRPGNFQFMPPAARSFAPPREMGRPQFNGNFRPFPPIGVPTPVPRRPSVPPAIASAPIRQQAAVPPARFNFAPGPVLRAPNSDRSFLDRRVVSDPVVSSKPSLRSGRVQYPMAEWRQRFFRDGHRHHHRFIFINSCWFWWDPWYSCWYYWPGPPPPPDAYEDDWQFAPDNGLYTSPADYERGREWGQDLRREIVSWEVFVEFLRANIVGASPVVFSEFRRGFIVGYGENALAAFDKAMQQAAPPPPNADAESETE